MSKDKVYAQHMLDAISLVREFVGDHAEEVMVDAPNKMVQSAVVRQLEVIGEAARYLSEHGKDTMPNIPWRDIVDMRNKLIHEYFGVDYDEVLAVILQDLGPLEEALVQFVDTQTNA